MPQNCFSFILGLFFPLPQSVDISRCIASVVQVVNDYVKNLGRVRALLSILGCGCDITGLVIYNLNLNFVSSSLGQGLQLEEYIVSLTSSQVFQRLLAGTGGGRVE